MSKCYRRILSVCTLFINGVIDKLYSFKAKSVCDSLRSLVRNVDVVSFDIFDTLLLRNHCRPADVFLLMELECNSPGFAFERVKAENMAIKRLKGIREPRLTDIYNELPKYKHLYEVEIDYERRALRGNEEIRGIWELALSLGKKVVVISDMYLPSHFLKEVLDREGFSGADNLFVSCEENARKSDGKLFDLVVEKLNLRPQKVLHIGDNVRSDYRMPRRVGIKAWLYRRPLEKFLETYPFARKFYKLSRHNFESRMFLATLVQHWQSWSNNGGCHTYWENIGFLFGAPLIAGFVGWIHSAALKDGIKRLLFIARDGWSPCRVFKLAYNDISAEYVYAPRSVSAFLINAGGANDDVNGDKTVARAQLGDVKVDEFMRYFESLNIVEDNVGVVDGPSQSFSAQTLLEFCARRRLTGYYADIIRGRQDESHRSFSISTSPFFIEQLLSSPELPIMSVVDGKPIYLTNTVAGEVRASKCFAEIARGEEFGSVRWLESKYMPTAKVLSWWIEAFSRNPSKEDLVRYESIRHGVDILHRKDKPIFPTWSANALRRTSLLIKCFLFESKLATLTRERKDGYIIRRVYIIGVCVFKTKEVEA